MRSWTAALAVACSLLAAPSEAVQPGAARDVFIFHTGGNGDDVLAQYNWSVVSIVGVFGDPTDTEKYGDVLGVAHANGAKVVHATSYDLDQITNVTYREEWVQEQLDDALAKGYDGVNIDKEGGTHDTAQQEGYVQLVQALAAAFHDAINGSHVSCDLPAYPSYEHWGYDYAGLGEAADALFIMDYDNFAWDDYSCATRHDCSPANAPYVNLASGMQQYMDLGIDPAKLVLGVPWYGIMYTRVAGVPFNMGQIHYGDVLALIDANPQAEVQWDGNSQTWRLVCHGPCSGLDDESLLKVSEVWFDDATSLDSKYALAPQYQLGGLGMWTSASLDYTGRYPDQTTAMWTALSAAAAAPARAANTPPPLQWYRSSREITNEQQEDRTSAVPGDQERLTRRPNVEWTTRDATSSGATSITIDRTATKQTIEGFGGAITDSAASVFAQLHGRAQFEVLDLLWSDKGNRLSLMRVPIGATDFATGVYSYDDVSDDFSLDHFSVERDEQAVLPFIRAARSTAAKAGRDLRVLATPWSAPGWLKRNGHVRNSFMPGLVQTNASFTTYADYIAAFVSAYEQAEVPVWAVTVQNEPHVADQFMFTYPSMGYNGTHEGAFLGTYLGPRLKSEFPDLKIFVHDDQKMQHANDTFMVDRVAEIMAQPGAADFADGVAFHCPGLNQSCVVRYGANLNNFAALQQLHDEHPDLTLLATEATLKWPSLRKWHEAVKYGVDIVNDLRNHAAGWIEWNVLLDGKGGPTCIGPMPSEACEWLGNHSFGHCDAPLRAELGAHGHVHVGDQYWILGHFSRFLAPGSKVVQDSGAADQSQQEVQWVAAVTPQGGLVVVVLNTGEDQANIELGFADTDPDFAGFSAELSLPAHSANTFVLPVASAEQ